MVHHVDEVFYLTNTLFLGVLHGVGLRICHLPSLEDSAIQHLNNRDQK